MIKDNNKKIICSFYKFKKIKNLYSLKKNLLNIIKKNQIFGTVIIAKEGINGSLSGTHKSIVLVEDFLKNEISSNLIFKNHFYIKDPFLRQKVKIKKEIVRLGLAKVNVEKTTGKYIKPEGWSKFVNDSQTVVIDARNKYESEIGFFKNAITPETDSFSEFPDWIKRNKEKLKGKKIAMYCTGGIRCEKASSYMIDLGLKDIYQLEGGILNYLDLIKSKDNLWNGECFVFDDRVSVNNNLKKGKYVQCFACRSALSEKDVNSKHYIKGISCKRCYDKTSLKKKRGLAEREKQIKIAKIRETNHFVKKNKLK
jgi:UPF0176 protein